MRPPVEPESGVDEPSGCEARRSVVARGVAGATTVTTGDAGGTRGADCVSGAGEFGTGVVGVGGAGSDTGVGGGAWNGCGVSGADGVSGVADVTHGKEAAEVELESDSGVIGMRSTVLPLSTGDVGYDCCGENGTAGEPTCDDDRSIEGRCDVETRILGRLIVAVDAVLFESELVVEAVELESGLTCTNRITLGDGDEVASYLGSFANATVVDDAVMRA